MTRVRNLIGNPGEFLGDVLIGWGIIILKKFCQICNVKVWAERGTGTSVEIFLLQ
jgi:hypothetical protein